MKTFLTFLLPIATFALTACSSAAEAGPIVGEFKVPATTTPEIRTFHPTPAPSHNLQPKSLFPRIPFLRSLVPVSSGTVHLNYGQVCNWTAVGIPPLSEGSGYGQKVVFWDEEYDWITNQQPELTLTGRRLDGKAPRVEVDHATNGYTPEFGPFMLTGVEIPTTGCWEITGAYEGTELSFVVWVTP
ncbi:MAG: hypothetical protein R3C44_02805 [Chloroflexota bacterium]